MDDTEEVIERAQEVMHQCQVGIPRRPSAYNELHGLLADAYGTIGALLEQHKALEEQLEKHNAQYLELRQEAYDLLAIRDGLEAENAQHVAAIASLQDQLRERDELTRKAKEIENS